MVQRARESEKPRVVRCRVAHERPSSRDAAAALTAVSVAACVLLNS